VPSIAQALAFADKLRAIAARTGSAVDGARAAEAARAADTAIREQRLAAQHTQQLATEARYAQRAKEAKALQPELEAQAASVAALREKPHTNPYTGQMTLPGIAPLTSEQEKLQAAARVKALRKETEFGAPGYDPDRARAATEAFLTAGRDNPNLFLYGTAPPPNLRHMEDLADYYSKQSGHRINVDYAAGESDEPYKIKEPKEHGRGEVMRNEYGDYKYATHERGDSPMYDPYGDIKKVEKEVELVGPPQEHETTIGLYGTKKVPKEARGGEIKYDEYGDTVFQKSRGGEPVLDERGRQKYREVENPDYSEQEGFELSVPSKRSTINYIPEEGSIAASSGGSSGGGQLLYQLANTYALRHGLDIKSTSGLTPVNMLRLLGNSLSTYARHGENPRYVTGTIAGDRPVARGKARGFDLWNAETGATEARLKNYVDDPRRVEFDGENFLLDGQPTTAKEIEANLPHISPDFKETGVGTKTLQRAAVLRHLENTSPQEAASLGQRWNLGPLFAGVGGASVGLGALGSGLRETQPGYD